MARILAVVFLGAAVIVHGGFASIHSHWFGWTGLALLGLFCLALGSPPGGSGWREWLRKRGG